MQVQIELWQFGILIVFLVQFGIYVGRFTKNFKNKKDCVNDMNFLEKRLHEMNEKEAEKRRGVWQKVEDSNETIHKIEVCLAKKGYEI